MSFFIAVVVGEEKEERTNIFMKSIPFTSEVFTAAVGTTTTATLTTTAK